MLTYLLIGVIVQMVIVVIRWKVRKVASFEGWDLYEWVIFAWGATCNILAWPFTIVAEIINTKNGV